MDPARKVLLLDGLIGATMLLNSGLLYSLSVQWWAVLVFPVAAVWFAGLLYWIERTAVGERLRDILVGSLALAAPVLVALVMTVSDLPLGKTVWVGVFTGYGLGLLGYRFVYGIVRPIPEQRLERVSRWAV